MLGWGARGRGRLPVTTVASVSLTGAVLFLAGAEAFYGWFGPPNWRGNTGDLIIYTDAAIRLFRGEDWFLQRQLEGPYQILFGDVLLPPTTAWLFLPWTVLPGWSFVLPPIVATVAVVAYLRPRPWAWPLMALCVLWPGTLLKTLSANPNSWVMMAIAFAMLIRWPAAFVLLKPTVLPFALIGASYRAWWLAMGLLALLSLPFLEATLAYPRVLLDAVHPSGWLYSLGDVPMLLIPVIAWTARSRRHEIPYSADAKIQPSSSA